MLKRSQGEDTQPEEHRTGAFDVWLRADGSCLTTWRAAVTEGRNEVEDRAEGAVDGEHQGVIATMSYYTRSYHARTPEQVIPSIS